MHQVPTNPVAQPSMHNIQVVPVDVHRPDIRTPTQLSGQTLYPPLSTDNTEQVVTPVQQSLQPQQQNRSSRTGDTTNPGSDLPDRLLADEHYVADVATQHNTSTVGTLRPTSKAKRKLNLPSDYEVKQEPPKVNIEPNTADRDSSVTTPIATTSTANQQNTGETSFVWIYDGPYGPLVRYPVGNTDETLFYTVAQILEGYLATKVIRDIAKVFLRAELDQFIKDSRYANFDDFPWLRGNVRHLFETFYNYELEVTFKQPGQSGNDDKEEDLDDTLPYDKPPPLDQQPIIPVESSSDEIPDTSGGDGSYDNQDIYLSAEEIPADTQPQDLNDYNSDEGKWDHYAEQFTDSDKYTYQKTVANEYATNADVDDETDDNNLGTDFVDSDNPSMNTRSRGRDNQGPFTPHDPQDPHRSSFFMRRYNDTHPIYPGQPPNYGEHRLFVQGNPTHQNVPLYAPRRRRVAAAVYAARGGRGARGADTLVYHIK